MPRLRIDETTLFRKPAILIERHLRRDLLPQGPSPLGPVAATCRRRRRTFATILGWYGVCVVVGMRFLGIRLGIWVALFVYAFGRPAAAHPCGGHGGGFHGGGFHGGGFHGGGFHYYGGGHGGVGGDGWNGCTPEPAPAVPTQPIQSIVSVKLLNGDTVETDADGTVTAIRHDTHPPTWTNFASGTARWTDGADTVAGVVIN